MMMVGSLAGAGEVAGVVVLAVGVFVGLVVLEGDRQVTTVGNRC